MEDFFYVEIRESEIERMKKHLDILTPHYRQLKEREIRILIAKKYIENVVFYFRFFGKTVPKITKEIDFQI